MNSKKAAFMEIVISIVFAAAIIVSDHWLEGTQHGQTVTYILIVLWFIPFSFLLMQVVKNE